jgi:hypothetical protein
MKTITKEELEPILEEMVKMGLIKEGPVKNGKRTWYIPDGKEEAIEEVLKKMEVKK